MPPFFAFVVLALLSLVPPARAGAGPGFGLNDLSVLLPLPHSEAEEAALLRPESVGAQGALLPAHIVKRLPPLVIGGDQPNVTKAALRVLGLRFDPCFREADGSCHHQIRLVLQPIGIFRRAWISTDAAVHAFYDFPEARWREIVAEWRELAVGKPTEPLGVHPQISAEGLGGPHWAKLKALVLRHCGRETLWRTTMMSVNLFGSQWTFLNFHVTPERELKSQRVPRLRTGGQTFFGDLGNLAEFAGSVMPPPEGERTLPELWRDSVTTRAGSQEETLRAAVERAISFEHPEKFNPGNLDCVSCHLAQNTRLWARRSFPEWPWRSMFEKEAYRSQWNLALTTPARGETNRVRAFGYFVDEPVIVQRVVNETAVAADQLAASLGR